MEIFTIIKILMLLILILIIAQIICISIKANIYKTGGVGPDENLPLIDNVNNIQIKINNNLPLINNVNNIKVIPININAEYLTASERGDFSSGIGNNPLNINFSELLQKLNNYDICPEGVELLMNALINNDSFIRQLFMGEYIDAFIDIVLKKNFLTIPNFGILSYMYISNIVKATTNVGDIKATTNVGDVKTTANVGDIKTTANVGDIKATANVGDVKATANVGDIKTTILQILLKIDLKRKILKRRVKRKSLKVQLNPYLDQFIVELLKFNICYSFMFDIFDKFYLSLSHFRRTEILKFILMFKMEKQQFKKFSVIEINFDNYEDLSEKNNIYLDIITYAKKLIGHYQFKNCHQLVFDGQIDNRDKFLNNLALLIIGFDTSTNAYVCVLLYPTIFKIFKEFQEKKEAITFMGKSAYNLFGGGPDYYNYKSKYSEQLKKLKSGISASAHEYTESINKLIAEYENDIYNVLEKMTEPNTNLLNFFKIPAKEKFTKAWVPMLIKDTSTLFTDERYREKKLFLLSAHGNSFPPKQKTIVLEDNETVIMSCNPLEGIGLNYFDMEDLIFYHPIDENELDKLLQNYICKGFIDRGINRFKSIHSRNNFCMFTKKCPNIDLDFYEDENIAENIYLKSSICNITAEWPIIFRPNTINELIAQLGLNPSEISEDVSKLLLNHDGPKKKLYAASCIEKYFYNKTIFHRYLYFVIFGKFHEKIHYRVHYFLVNFPKDLSYKYHYMMSNFVEFF